MLRIGLIGGNLGEQVYEQPYRRWMDDFPDKYHNEKTGEYLFEQALATSMEHYYKDVKATYIPSFNEAKIQKNHVNFLVGNNLLNAWEKSS